MKVQRYKVSYTLQSIYGDNEARFIVAYSMKQALEYVLRHDMPPNSEYSYGEIHKIELYDHLPNNWQAFTRENDETAI